MSSQVVINNFPLMIDGADVQAERRPFLESGPESVKLTPSWEDRNLPAAELNLRGLESDLDKAALDMDPPPDRLAYYVTPKLFLPLTTIEYRITSNNIC